MKTYNLFGSTPEEITNELNSIDFSDEEILLIKKVIAQNKLNFDEVVKKYSPLIGLHGDSYNFAIKLHFYSVIANQLKQNFFTYDCKPLDIRISLLVLINAGYGKKEFANFIKSTINGIGKSYVEPTSYYPEQFIGRVNTREIDGETEYIPIPGFLINDYVVIDEGKELLTSQKSEYLESLKNVRIALDPIGFNTITKKQVGVPDAYKLQYDPTCTIAIYAQPLNDINDELLTKGTLRRFILIILNVPKEERTEARHKGKFLTNAQILEAHQKLLDEWIDLNKKLSARKISFNGNDDDFKLIDIYIDGLDIISNPSVLKYIKSTEFNIKYTIFRFAAIRAILESINDNVTITRSHIESAIEDFKLLWIPLIQWISQSMVIVDVLNDDSKFVIAQLKDGELEQSKVIANYVQADFNQDKNKTTLKNTISKTIKWLKEKMYIDERPLQKNAKMLFLTESGKQLAVCDY